MANQILANPLLANPFSSFVFVLSLLGVVVVVCCRLCRLVLGVGVGVGVVVGFGPSGSPPLHCARPPCARPPCAGPPQNFALFCPSPAPTFALFYLFLGVFSLNFGGVFEGRHPQMCTLGLCPKNSKREHFRAPAFRNTTKIQREDTQREIKRENGGGEKSSKFWAPPPFRPPRGPTLRDPIFSGFWGPRLWAPH